MLPAPQVTLPMSRKIANILGPHYGWSLWKKEDRLADLVEFFCSGSAVQRSLWAKLEKRVPVSEAQKKRRRTEAANAVTPLSVVDLVLLLKIPRRRYYCAREEGRGGKEEEEGEARGREEEEEEGRGGEETEESRGGESRKGNAAARAIDVIARAMHFVARAMPCIARAMPLRFFFQASKTGPIVKKAP